LDLSSVVSDPDLAEPFQITRNTGAFGLGGWIPGTPTVIPAYGIVSVAKQADLDAIPEADKISEAMVFHSTQEMFITNAAGSATSDTLQWQGTNYRVYSVANYSNRGYWKAIATRLSGS
jgi:hypothetical protein